MNDEKKYVLVTTLGEDRPGIVEDISGWILKKGGNIEDSRMSRLGGEFATLILVTGSGGFAENLEKTREAFEKEHGLTVITKEVRSGPNTSAEPILRYYLQAASLDHPGIVHKVSQLMHRHRINIVSAETRTVSAPFSGAPAFHLDMEIDVPGSVPIRKLREDLATLGDEKNIDFILTVE